MIYGLLRHARQKVEKDAVLLGKLGAKGANGLHHNNLELVRDLGDEAGYLLHEPVNARFGAGLEQGRDGQGGD